MCVCIVVRRNIHIQKLTKVLIPNYKLGWGGGVGGVSRITNETRLKLHKLGAAVGAVLICCCFFSTTIAKQLSRFEMQLLYPLQMNPVPSRGFLPAFYRTPYIHTYMPKKKKSVSSYAKAALIRPSVMKQTRC